MHVRSTHTIIFFISLFCALPLLGMQQSNVQHDQENQKKEILSRIFPIIVEAPHRDSQTQQLMESSPALSSLLSGPKKTRFFSKSANQSFFTPRGDRFFIANNTGFAQGLINDNELYMYHNLSDSIFWMREKPEITGSGVNGCDGYEFMNYFESSICAYASCQDPNPEQTGHKIFVVDGCNRPHSPTQDLNRKNKYKYDRNIRLMRVAELIWEEQCFDGSAIKGAIKLVSCKPGTNQLIVCAEESLNVQPIVRLYNVNEQGNVALLREIQDSLCSFFSQGLWWINKTLIALACGERGNRSIRYLDIAVGYERSKLELPEIFAYDAKPNKYLVYATSAPELVIVDTNNCQYQKTSIKINILLNALKLVSDHYCIGMGSRPSTPILNDPITCVQLWDLKNKMMLIQYVLENLPSFTIATRSDNNVVAINGGFWDISDLKKLENLTPQAYAAAQKKNEKIGQQRAVYDA